MQSVNYYRSKGWNVYEMSCNDSWTPLLIICPRNSQLRCRSRRAEDVLFVRKRILPLLSDTIHLCSEKLKARICACSASFSRHASPYCTILYHSICITKSIRKTNLTQNKKFQFVHGRRNSGQKKLALCLFSEYWTQTNLCIFLQLLAGGQFHGK